MTGRPRPSISWFSNGRLLPSSFEVSSGSTVTSGIVVSELSRSDDSALLTCEATNNHISRPARSSVSIVMKRESSTCASGIITIIVDTLIHRAPLSHFSASNSGVDSKQRQPCYLGRWCRGLSVLIRGFVARNEVGCRKLDKIFLHSY